MKGMTVSWPESPVLTIVRQKGWTRPGVYLILAPKMIRYKHGRSRILHIGVAGKGSARIGQQVNSKMRRALEMHGVRRVEVVFVPIKRRQGLAPAKEAEALLLTKFYQRHGRVPRLDSNRPKPKGAPRFGRSLYRPLDDLSEGGIQLPF